MPGPASNTRKTFTRKAKVPKGSAKSLAVSNYKALSNLKQKVRSEVKYFHRDAQPDIDWFSIFYDLCLPAVGTSNEMRVGDQITCKSIKLNGVLATTGLNATVRIIILKDKQNLVNAGTSIMYAQPGNVFAPIEHFAKDKARRYTVLYDRMFSVDTYNPQKVIKIALYGLNDKVTFQGSSTTVNSGGLKLMLVGDSAPGSSKPVFKFLTEATFTDS